MALAVLNAAATAFASKQHEIHINAVCANIKVPHKWNYSPFALASAYNLVYRNLFFTAQSKDGLSGLHLGRLLGLSINAVCSMKQKTQHLMKSATDPLRLEIYVKLDDVYWGWLKKMENEVMEHQEKPYFLPQSPITIKDTQCTCA